MSKKYFCIDCKKLIKHHNKAKRCWKCYKIFLSKKVKKVYRCKDCGKEISYGAKRCIKYSNKGKNNPNFGKKGKESSNYKDGRCSKTYYCKEENCNNDICADNALYGKGRCKSCSANERFRKKEHPMKGKKHSKETREKIRQKLIDRIKDGKYKLKPNKPEKLLTKLLNKWLKGEYKFVGDGKVIIDRYCPDFINVNGQKKIIEHFGNYWHNRPEVIKRDKRRLVVYKKYGYSTLIIWERELKDLNKLKKKILKFQNV